LHQSVDTKFSHNRSKQNFTSLADTKSRYSYWTALLVMTSGHK